MHSESLLRRTRYIYRDCLSFGFRKGKDGNRNRGLRESIGGIYAFGDFDIDWTRLNDVDMSTGKSHHRYNASLCPNDKDTLDLVVLNDSHLATVDASYFEIRLYFELKSQ